MHELPKDMRSLLVVEDTFFETAIKAFEEIGFTYDSTSTKVISAKYPEAERILYIAKTLEEALSYIDFEKALEAETPDIVVSDVNFPRKEGDEPEELGYWLVNESISAGIPGVLLTDKEGERSKSHGGGEYSYLVVPPFVPVNEIAQGITGIALSELAPAKSNRDAWVCALYELIEKYSYGDLMDTVLNLKKTEGRNPVWPKE